MFVQIRYSNVLKINDKLDNFFESVAYEDSLLAFDPRIEDLRDRSHSKF